MFCFLKNGMYMYMYTYNFGSLIFISLYIFCWLYLYCWCCDLYVDWIDIYQYVFCLKFLYFLDYHNFCSVKLTSQTAEIRIVVAPVNSIPGFYIFLFGRYIIHHHFWLPRIPIPHLSGLTYCFYVVLYTFSLNILRWSDSPVQKSAKAWIPHLNRLP